ncbi:MAG: restriction endonuclease subunit S [Candidatus Omnitrophica bacterium]|nr:restriction endonuclease subunit S [Candidatus Omnitrophota bacterium]
MKNLKLPPKTVVISCLATVGEVGIIIKESFTNQQINSVICDENKIVPEFLYYYFKYSKPRLLKYSGSVYTNISKSKFADFEIEIPQDISEQKRIADILSAFDEKIELNNKINKTLEEMAQAIFREWFINNKKFKIGSEKLSNLVDPQYGYTETASDKEIGPKFLRVKDINKNDWIDWNAVPYCKISNKDFEKYRLKKGDIVIARMADPGKVGIIEQEVKAVFGSYLIRLSIKSEKVKPYYLYYYIKSPLYQNFIFGASTGTTRKSANARVLTDCYIIIPRKEALENFEKIAGDIRQKINSNLKENQTLAAFRDLLLPKLMSGEIRV